jgi:hypothetical protein
MKKFIITLLENLLAKLKPQEKKTIKYRFLEILKSKGKSRRKDLINYILMAQYDVKNQDTKEYNSSLYKGVSRGYYSTNLCTWLDKEGIIDRDSESNYTISKSGLEYLKNPKSIRYSNLIKKADRIQRNGERMAQKLNYIHKGFERNDIWDSLSFWKSEGFREELTRDKRQYLDCLIGFVEDVADNGEVRYQLGESYRKDIAISFSTSDEKLFVKKE